jgi:hypothetical protein
MPTFLLTITAVEADSQGIRLSPGIRLSHTTDRPAIRHMMQGAALELRRPDGSRQQTCLVTYGVSVLRGDDGAFYMHDDPTDPEIKITLPGDLSPNEIPPGTEVWLLAE